MKILVLNTGSSTLRYKLIDTEKEKTLASGKYERIGEKASFVIHNVNSEKIQIGNYVKNHTEAMRHVLDLLVESKYRVINSLEEIDAIGHRIVHGGPKITESTIITDEVLVELRRHLNWAPLHNPGGIAGVNACKELMPRTPMVAVLDTTFHKTLAKEQYTYGLPEIYYKKYGIRKYGFHGTSYRYVTRRMDAIEGVKGKKMVICHLGSGASVCAVKDGISVDTSMGFTPNAGMPMVTRCGDIAPSIVTFIMKKENLSIEEMERILSFKSGISGLAGTEPDYRMVKESAEHGNENAKLAINLFEKGTANFIAEYAVTMGGLDTIVFTSGIGENDALVRANIIKRLEFFGAKIDEEVNNASNGKEAKISTADSKIGIYVIPTDEEAIIAEDTEKLIGNK